VRLCALAAELDTPIYRWQWTNCARAVVLILCLSLDAGCLESTRFGSDLSRQEALLQSARVRDKALLKPHRFAELEDYVAELLAGQLVSVHKEAVAQPKRLNHSGFAFLAASPKFLDNSSSPKVKRMKRAASCSDVQQLVERLMSASSHAARERASRITIPIGEPGRGRWFYKDEIE